MNYADRAEEIMKSGLNCAQAVADAFADLVKDDINQSALLKLASPFGGGFARKRDLCGAVSGMGMVYGLIFGNDTPDKKMDTYEKSATLIDRFIARYGTIVCAELLEKKPALSVTPREVEWTDEEKEKFNWPCIDYVRGAAQVFEEYLKEQGIID